MAKAIGLAQTNVLYVVLIRLVDFVVACGAACYAVLNVDDLFVLHFGLR